MKNTLQQRRDVGAICSICRSPDYSQLPANFIRGKPNFKCNSCGHTWQYGKDGGKFAMFAEN